MSNLLRSDFYRLFKSKAFYICTGVASFLMGLNIFMSYWASHLNAENEKAYADMLPKDGISYGLSAFAAGNVQMILAIITAIFITSEFAHGTMKNVVSKGFSKIKIYFSKLITMLAAVYIIIFTTLIVGTICCTIVTGTVGDFTGEYVSQILKTVGIELLLNAAMTALLVLVAMVVRNLGGVIAINILGIMSFGPLIFTLLEYLVKHKIKFSEFSLSYNIQYFMGDVTKGSDFLRGAIVALAFIVVSTALGIFAFKKTDVK